MKALKWSGNEKAANIEKSQLELIAFTQGHDTTGWAIAWSLYQLGIYRDVQSKVHDELDSVFGGDRTRPTTSDDLKQLPYVDRVLKECQRLNGSVPVVSRRCTVDGAKLGRLRMTFFTQIVESSFRVELAENTQL